MRFFPIFLSFLFFFHFTTWETDFESAKKKASEENKLILLNFSGSDWCGPCIRLRSEIFENPSFQEFADRKLVLLNADFPRLKKNQLSKEQQKKNDKLADQYNPQGSFPYTILMHADGKVIMSWDGYPDETPEKFTQQLKSLAGDIQ